MQTYNIALTNIVVHSDVSGDKVRGEGKGKLTLESFSKRKISANGQGKVNEPF